MWEVVIGGWHYLVRKLESGKIEVGGHGCFGHWVPLKMLGDDCLAGKICKAIADFPPNTTVFLDDGIGHPQSS